MDFLDIDTTIKKQKSFLNFTPVILYNTAYEIKCNDLKFLVDPVENFTVC